MKKADAEHLADAIRAEWTGPPSSKARPYVREFFERSRQRRKIEARVEGNHGVYTVSIESKGDNLAAACGCYIGRHGGCHHCEALAHTFLREPASFAVIKTQRWDQVRSLDGLRTYLKSTRLEQLLDELKTRGVSRKAFAESIGMNPRRLSSIQSSEARNHYYNELGATKLACLWVLEHIQAGDS